MRGLLGAALAALLLAPASAPAGPQPFFVSAARAFDGTRAITPAVVEIRGTKVVAVGVRSIPAHARVIRLGDATILPGLIDLHVHESPAVLLRDGVTTTRNLGEQLSTLRPTHADRGYPRIAAAGPLITVPGGYPTRVDPPLAAPVTSAAEGARVVDTLVRRGAALVKIALETGADGSRPTLTVDEVRAIVAEAHRLNRIVTAHVLEGPGLQIALDGGVDELAHMPCTGVTSTQIATLVERHVPVVGTLHVGRLYAGDSCLANARAFVAAGGELLYGTDIPAVPVGLDLTELAFMQSAGLSTRQVLHAATAEAGAELGLAPLGTLRPGAPADLLAVRGDPLLHLSALARPVLVVARGVRVR